MMRRLDEFQPAYKRAVRWGCIGGILLSLILGTGAGEASEPSPRVPAYRPESSTSFSVGVAQRDITPRKPMPMWGYGARHDRLSEGVLDPCWPRPW